MRPARVKCDLDEDCRPPGECYQVECYHGRCVSYPREGGHCELPSGAQGECFSNRCISREDWAEYCGRFWGSGAVRSGIVREGEEFGLAWGNKAYARQEFADHMRGKAESFVRCIQYPGTIGGYMTLDRWDGSDPLDSHGKGKPR